MFNEFEESAKHVPALEPADGERTWRITDGAFPVAHGSVPGTGIGPRLDKQIEWLKEKDPAIGHELSSRYEAVSEEAKRYRLTRAEFSERLQVENSTAERVNHGIEVQLRELEDERAREIHPILIRIDELKVSLFDQSHQLAVAEGNLEAIRSAARISYATAARLAGMPYAPRLGRGTSVWLLAASIVCGATIGAHLALSIGVDTTLLAEGDPLSVWKFALGVVAGMVALVCAKLAIGSMSENARATFEDGSPGWRRWATCTACLIGWLTLVEIVILRMGLIRSNFVPLLTGQLGLADLTIGSLALGCLLSFCVLLATALHHWKLGHVNPLLDRIASEREIERDQRFPTNQVDEVTIAASVARKVKTVLEAQIESEKRVLEKIDAYFDEQVRQLRSGKATIRLSLAPSEKEALRRQIVNGCVLTDEANRLKSRALHALTELSIADPEPERVAKAVVFDRESPDHPWKMLKSFLGIG